MKEKIRAAARSLGADVCGFAGRERFSITPKGYCPSDIFSPCRSVVVIGVALPKGLLEVEPRLVYGYFNHQVSATVDAIAFRLAKIIEQQTGFSAVPIPCDNPYEYWDSEHKEGRGLMSMKHAAVMAGLGSIGKNTLFLSPEFGNRLCIGAVLTDLQLESDPPCRDVCLEACRKCIDSCPVSAIRDGRVNQYLCRNHTYGQTARGFGTVDCNRCRTVCPMRSGNQNTRL